MKAFTIILIACFSLVACGKKADLKLPPEPEHQEEQTQE